jgi:hypothetical protein
MRQASLLRLRKTGAFREDVQGAEAMTKTIAFCARFGRRHEILLVASVIGRLGYDVTSRWLWSHRADEDLTDREKTQVSLEDLNDIGHAQTVVLFLDPPGTPGADRGGRFIEFGWAMRDTTKRLIVVGPREWENVFARAPGIIRVEGKAELIELLKETP